MGRLVKSLAVLCLLLAVTAAPSAPVLARQYNDFAADTAVQTVRALIARIDAQTAAVKAHRFAPVYYDGPPCTPLKEDGDKSLSAYRAERRAIAADIVAVKARMKVLEAVSSSAVVLANNGWKVKDQNSFKELNQAYRNLEQAIAQKEALLDSLVRPCPKPTTAPPKPRITPETPLTPAEEGQFTDDFPLPQPVFDDPVTMPTPPRFCTFAERKAWMDSVYWPTVKRAEANALKAIDTYSKAEQRLRDVRASDRPDSPRIALAERAVTAWEKIKNDRMAAHRALLAIDVPNPVDCGKPSTTTGGTGVTPPQPPVTTPPPVTDGPGVAPPPPPPGVSRPQFERFTVPTLPRRFCSEKEKQDFLVNVYHPAAEAASKNAVRASEYRKRLSDLIYEATVQRNEARLASLKAEYDSWNKIAEEAERLQTQMMRMRAQILAIPVVDCSKPEQPGTTPPPADDGLEDIIIQGQPIRPGADDGPRPPAKPKLPRPSLSRPQFERVRDVVVPTKFCSAFERNDFLNNVYNPAVAAALANARTAQAHQAKLNAMFTEYMKANSEYWGEVRAERDAFEAITNEALAKSGALNDLYPKIMAVPIVPCDPKPDAPPPPTTTPPPPPPPVTDGPGPSGPTDGPGGSTELGDVIFPNIDLPPLPEEFCQGDENNAEDAVERARRTVAENEQRVKEYRGELEEQVRFYSQHDKPREAAAARSRLEALKDIEARLVRDRAAIDAYEKKAKALGQPKDCPPPADGPGVSRPPPPAVLEIVPPLPPVNPCDLIDRLRYARQLKEAYDRIAAAADELEDYLFGTGFAIGPEREALRARLRDYEDDLEDIEDELDSLAFGALSLTDRCPPPADDGPTTEPKKPCPPKKGRESIVVGPNSKVGSGAQLRSKVGGIITSTALGALGVGGGGGGGSEPQLWTCKIKESEYTVFDNAATGVSLRVAAKRAKGGKVIIFSEIAKSPDKGTFQTAFLERPSTGETLAPSDIGPCDLWGEWKLTVSWTKTTYVNGQVVDRQSGGWSEGGFFKIPGVLSPAEAPNGYWKQMGFSSAQMGAREMGMIFDVPPGGGPLTFVIHVTRPKGDPVTTVPFVLTMTEGPNGFVFTQAEDPPCPPEAMPASYSPPAGTTERPWEPADVAAPPEEAAPTGSTFDAAPADYTPPRDATEEEPTGPGVRRDLAEIRKDVAFINQEIQDGINFLTKDRCGDIDVWKDDRDNILNDLRRLREQIKQWRAAGPNASAIEMEFVNALTAVEEAIKEVENLDPPPPASPAPATCPKGPSLLDEVAPAFDAAPAPYTPRPDDGGTFDGVEMDPPSMPGGMTTTGGSVPADTPPPPTLPEKDWPKERVYSSNDLRRDANRWFEGAERDLEEMLKEGRPCDEEGRKAWDARAQMLKDQIQRWLDRLNRMEAAEGGEEAAIRSELDDQRARFERLRDRVDEKIRTAPERMRCPTPSGEEDIMDDMGPQPYNDGGGFTPPETVPTPEKPTPDKPGKPTPTKPTPPPTPAKPGTPVTSVPLPAGPGGMTTTGGSVPAGEGPTFPPSPGGTAGGTPPPPPPPPEIPVERLDAYDQADARARALSEGNRRALEDARCEGPDVWEDKRNKLLEALRRQLRTLDRLKPGGPDAATIAERIKASKARISAEIEELKGMKPPPAPKVCPAEPEDILEDIDEVFVPA